MVLSRFIIIILIAIAQLIGNFMFMPYLTILSIFGISMYDNRKCTISKNLMRSLASVVLCTLAGFIIPLIPIIGIFAMMPIIGSLIVGAGKGIVYTGTNNMILWLIFGSC